MAGERIGVPSVSIITEQFVSAAELMATVLGADGYPFVTMPHPISSATADVLAGHAKVAAQQCADLLTRS